MLRQFGVACGPSVHGGLEVSLYLHALTLDNASTIKLLDIPVCALTFCTLYLVYYRNYLEYVHVMVLRGGVSDMIAYQGDVVEHVCEDVNM